MYYSRDQLRRMTKTELEEARVLFVDCLTRLDEEVQERERKEKEREEKRIAQMEYDIITRTVAYAKEKSLAMDEAFGVLINKYYSKVKKYKP